jgi:hypothetical protein
MPRTLAQPPRPSAAAATAMRIAFADPTAAVPADGRTLRTFADPRPAAAVATPADPASLADEPVWPEPSDALLVRVSPDRRPAGERWLDRPDHPDAPLPVEVAIEGGRLRWRPGRAVLEGPLAPPDDVLAGLADFAFYEGELRRLESALPPFEGVAAGDAPFAYDICQADRDRWPRFRRTVEQLAVLRLTFARLEPRLARPSRALPPEARRAFGRLCVRAQVEDRLAAVSDRLEACEDLYEGAVDRITDHRWWHKGHRLEAIIVALLAIEGVQLAVELMLRLRGR